MTTVAVMQPYFYPYGGYFRLLAAADVFVVFDCVQFPRRGWVHRNRLARGDGSLDWLTLPLKKADYHAAISTLAFADGAAEEFCRRCAAFPGLAEALASAQPAPLIEGLLDFRGSVVDYLERGLRACADALGFSPRFERSSSLGLGDDLHGPARVRAAARAFGADEYVNLSGGLDYYDPAEFTAAGMHLRVLKPYEGKSDSMLGRLIKAPAADVRAEILDQMQYYEG